MLRRLRRLTRLPTDHFPMPELTPQAVADLVDRFYDRVRADPDIGPVFNAAIDDWPEHKRLLTSFWCSVALGMRSYRGNPMAAHRPHPIRPEHFTRWLALWSDVAESVLPPEHAAPMVDYATRIGRSLRVGLGRGEPGASR